MRIEVDCERLRRNTEAVARLCARQGIELAGVTKACCGDPAVARAMLAGGAKLLAESRLPHVRRLRPFPLLQLLSQGQGLLVAAGPAGGLGPRGASR